MVWGRCVCMRGDLRGCQGVSIGARKILVTPSSTDAGVEQCASKMLLETGLTSWWHLTNSSARMRNYAGDL